MLRPSAKPFLLILLILSVIFGSLMIGAYISLNLTENDSSSVEKVYLEKGSLVNLKLLNFYLSAQSSTAEHDRFKKAIEMNTSPFKGFYALKDNLEFKISKSDKRCFRGLNCSQVRVNLGEISSNVWRALVGIEDSRYLNHQGVDWKSILRATYVNLVAGRIVQGGSTLTQQLVKNLFLSTERTFSRKIKEAFYSIIIEIKYSKLEIIEHYLNNVYWGSFKGLNIFGIKAASLFYFDKTPDKLSEFEAAILIGMLKGPSLYSPFNKNKDHLINRTNLIYSKLVNDGHFRGLSEEWSDAKWKSWFSRSYVEKYYQFKSINGLGVDSYQYFVLKYFLERKLGFLRKHFVKGDFGYNIVNIDIDNRIYEMSSHNSNIDVPKNIGSLLKPIVYSELFESFDENDYFSTSKFRLQLKSGEWSPSDHYDETESVSLKFSLQKSLNLPYLRAIKDFGFDKLETKLSNQIQSLKKPLREYPAQLLGAVELTTKDVALLYRNFLSNSCKNIMTKKVVEILSNPAETTTAKWAGILKGSRFFGKTGTSNNGYDNWFVFYDYRDLFVVWIGHLGPRDIGSLALSGAGVSFDVVRDFLSSRAKNIGQNPCDD